ncbi:MAG TPA: hypothetical protein VGF55_29535 [Gemmataceae bacterium]|jgi:hypothetical protein
MSRRIVALPLLILAWFAGPAPAADLDADPIRYASAPADNAISRLIGRLESGQATLARDDDHGYLRSVLRELAVPESSQVLVFSKTSLQRHRIGPKTPRAVYFNDDVYVGFCLRGDVIELSAADPQLGTAFYTLDQHADTERRITRQTESCLICHGSSQNQGFPGHLVRSVFADRQGEPILSAGSYRTDDTSPLRERWGGWYVTGTCGKQVHLGNLIVPAKGRVEAEENTSGVNVTDLSDRFTVGLYATPHSDIVALMTLEHQTEGHNRLARANLLTRVALHEEADLNKALGRPADYRSESTASRIRNAGEPLVKYLLFSGEAKLTDKVEGTSGFAREFAARGPFDHRGRSLREFDLEHRLFKYPCSYLIYSRSFDTLPGPVHDYVLRRLFDVLSGKDTSAAFAHLSAADRRAILGILRDTKPGLPDYWCASTDGH